MVYSERIAKWDNAKLILIFLVVFGHFLETFLEQYPVCESVYGIIYLFHMPAFLFISGMFSKRTINAEKLDWKKIVPYLLLFVILDFGRFIVRYCWDPTLTFRLFRITGVSWYLFALFVMIVVTHCLRKIDPKYVFMIAIGISLIIGYSKGIGYWFAFYRIVTMFPFFYLGYLWDRKKVEWALGRPWIRILAAAVLVLHLFGCLNHPMKVYFWEPLLTAGTNYYSIDFEAAPYPWLQEALPFEVPEGTVSDIIAQAEQDESAVEGTVLYQVPPATCLLRLGYYGMAFLALFAVLSLVPKRRIPVLSKMGSRTLSVYFWHLMIVEVLVHQRWLLDIVGKGGMQTIVLMLVLSAVVTGLLATKPCMVPLNWLMKPKRRKLE